jgi:hypothetical protein
MYQLTGKRDRSPTRSLRFLDPGVDAFSLTCSAS